MDCQSITKLLLNNESDLKEQFYNYKDLSDLYTSFDYIEKPVKYPVIICYHTDCRSQDRHDNLYFVYVYPEDFNKIRSVLWNKTLTR